MNKKRIKAEVDLPDMDFGGVDMSRGRLDAEDFSFAIVVSRFNDEFTGQLLSSTLDCLRKYGACDDDIGVYWVPGAYEIPQAVERILVSGDYDAVIALGCVIQGETPHAELINTSVAQALMDIARDYDVPIINEVVGTYDIKQAVVRCSYGEDSRGWYAAAAAIEMASLYACLEEKCAW